MKEICCRCKKRNATYYNDTLIRTAYCNKCLLEKTIEQFKFKRIKE